MVEDNFGSLSDKIRTIENIFSDNLNSNLPDPIDSFEFKLSAFEESKKEILNVQKKDIKTIEDKEFIDLSLTTLIKAGMKVIEKLSENFKIDSSPREAESFSMIMNSTKDAINEFRQHKKMLLDIENFQNDMNPVVPQNIQNNFFNSNPTSSEMFEMLEKIKSQSELNIIKAEFNVKEDKDLDTDKK